MQVVKYTFISDIFEKPCPGWAGDIQADNEWAEYNSELALDAIEFCFSNAEYFIKVTDCQRYAKGLQYIFSNNYSDLPFLFTNTNKNKAGKVSALKSFSNVIDNVFDKYCERRVDKIGNSIDGDLGYICYMLWDTTPICPSSIDADVSRACLDLMLHCIKSKNESIIISGLHGIGHWVNECPWILQELEKVDMSHYRSHILDYANAAKSGCVQ